MKERAKERIFLPSPAPPSVQASKLGVSGAPGWGPQPQLVTAWSWLLEPVPLGSFSQQAVAQLLGEASLIPEDGRGDSCLAQCPGWACTVC